MTLHAVLPAEVDDPALVSGGNVYDRRVLDGLRALGHDVREHLVDAGPTHGHDALARTLAAVPDDAPVLADGLVVCGAPGVVVPHAARLDLVVLVHLSLAEEAPERAAGERAVLTAARAVVVTSPWAAGRLAALHGIDDAFVVTPGVDPAPPTVPDEPGGRLLTLGAVTPTKGQDLLVDALADARDAAPAGWHATLAGPLARDPAFVAHLRARIVHHGLDGHVTLPGAVDGAAALAATDLLVLPSRVETFGMVAAEARARRVPVLASAVGGLPGTLGDAGTLVAPDAGAFGAALRRWWDEPDIRRGRRLSAQGPPCWLTGWPETSRRLQHHLRRVLDSLP